MLSDATIDAANRAIMQVFETTSMAWRTIPHWYTGDPGRTAIRSDDWFQFENPPGPGPGKPLGPGPYGGDADDIVGAASSQPLVVTLAAAQASTPDQVVSAVSARAVDVVSQFDQAVARQLAEPALQYDKTGDYKATVPPGDFSDGGDPKVPVKELLATRSTIEAAGYLSSRCVWAGKNYFVDMHGVDGTRSILPTCASLLHMSSIYEWATSAPLGNTIKVDGIAKEFKIDDLALIIGRRQEVAPGRAFEAAAAPEPIDLAVSVPPSLEIVGDTKDGNIQLAVRIGYALRFKDNRAVVVWTT